jgi:hypothetical protein
MTIVVPAPRQLDQANAKAAEEMARSGGYQPKDIDVIWTQFLITHMKTFAAFGMAWPKKNAA